jgi:hypothetical protein
VIGNRQRLALSAHVLVLACDLPPIEYETEHLRIGTDSAEPLCAGTLHELDAQVQIVEELLDFQVEDQLDLYLFEDGPSKWCINNVEGCYHRQEKRAYASIEAARHEIVHAALHKSVGLGDAFFDEGLAVDLTGQGLKFPKFYPTSNLGLSSIDVAQPAAGHFMRWLRSRHTASEIKNIMIYSKRDRGQNHAERAFRKATNDEFTDIEQLYLDTAPEFLAPFDIVAPPMVAPTDNGWDIVVSFDCTHTDTQGFGGKMWRRVRIEVPVPGPYVFVATPPATATITRHHTEDIEVGDPIPAAPHWPIGDDWFDPPEAPMTDWPTEVDLESGIYDIEITVPGTSPTTAAVGLHPKIGTLSTVP